MPDAKLKMAMEEIKAVLRKHDLAAIVILDSGRNMEHLMQIDPSWSAAFFEKPGFLRFRAKAADFPTKEAHKQCVELTTGMFIGFHDVMSDQLRQLEQVMKMCSENVGEVSHFTRQENTP